MHAIIGSATAIVDGRKRRVDGRKRRAGGRQRKRAWRLRRTRAAWDPGTSVFIEVPIQPTSGNIKAL